MANETRAQVGGEYLYSYYNLSRSSRHSSRCRQMDLLSSRLSAI